MFSLLFVVVPGESTNRFEKTSQLLHKAAARAHCTITVCSWEQREDYLSHHSFDLVGFISPEAHLAPHALEKVISVADSEKSKNVFYGDTKNRPLPDFSPQRLLCQNYLRDLVFIRPDVLGEIKQTNPPLGTSAGVYDLLLQLAQKPSQFFHIREVLVKATTNSVTLSPQEIDESIHVLTQARKKSGSDIPVTYIDQGVFYSRGHVHGSPLVSIVIPTRALYQGDDETQKSLVLNAVSSIISLTDYPHYEIVVVYDSVADPSILKALSEIASDRLVFVEWDKPFNFSQKMNYGVLHARGEFVLLLNDDVEVLSETWLSSMLALAQLPNAGMVGAMLYYEDDTIQHAGHAYYQGSPTHIGLGVPRGSQGPMGSYLVQREVSGVTAACALMPAEVFRAVGGFTALLPGNFNDVDLCLKVGWRGYDIYWTPDAQLYHFESKTRDAHVHYYELDVIEHRWGLRLNDQRYWRGHPASQR